MTLGEPLDGLLEERCAVSSLWVRVNLPLRRVGRSHMPKGRARSRSETLLSRDVSPRIAGVS
jgi:hypothetical protein